MISQESIAALKNHLDVLDIISHYIEVKKVGSTFKANCPFHQEKTPSFVINQHKGFYHCFGCGASGDGITFVMEYEKLSYVEAIEKLAQFYNITLTYTKGQKRNDDGELFLVMQNFYQQSLKPEICDYLFQRGLTQQSISQFALGYAPGNAEIIGFLQRNNYSMQGALNIGILGLDSENKVKRYYARLVHRIIFPITSAQNHIIGFGGRSLQANQAKYINSPQTRYFNKSQILYGYAQAKPSILKQQQIIITEGYLDVIMLHQAGICNAVATLGTALTPDHLVLLSKGDPEILLAYDGDRAGRNAALKAARLLSVHNKEGRVVLFAQGVDPADMVKNGEIDALHALFEGGVSLIAFVIDEMMLQFDLNNPLQKDRALACCVEYLHELTPLLQEEYRYYIASKLHIPHHLIQIKPKNQTKPTVSLAHSDFYALSEKILLKSMLEDKSLLAFGLDYLDRSMFISQKEAFIQILQGNTTHPLLVGILLDERICTLEKEDFKKQLIMLLCGYYEQKKQELCQEDYSLQEKAFLMRRYHEYLLNLKKGELVLYEGFDG